MSKTIDIRSDVQTRPTKAMYQVMLDTPLGDEQNEEDLTVLKLQKIAT